MARHESFFESFCNSARDPRTVNSYAKRRVERVFGEARRAASVCSRYSLQIMITFVAGCQAEAATAQAQAVPQTEAAPSAAAATDTRAATDSKKTRFAHSQVCSPISLCLRASQHRLCGGDVLLRPVCAIRHISA